VLGVALFLLVEFAERLFVPRHIIASGKVAGEAF
jgi:hypothetical protein